MARHGAGSVRIVSHHRLLPFANATHFQTTSDALHFQSKQPIVEQGATHGHRVQRRGCALSFASTYRRQKPEHPVSTAIPYPYYALLLNHLRAAFGKDPVRCHEIRDKILFLTELILDPLPTAPAVAVIVRALQEAVTDGLPLPVIKEMLPHLCDGATNPVLLHRATSFLAAIQPHCPALSAPIQQTAEALLARAEQWFMQQDLRVHSARRLLTELLNPRRSHPRAA